MQSAIPIFDPFNTFLQATEPLIHMLHQSAFHLYQSLLSRFVLPEVLADSSNDYDFIDIYEEENLKDHKNIYIGHMTKQFAGEMTSLGLQGIENVSVNPEISVSHVTYFRK